LQDRAEIFCCGSNLILVVADGAGGRSGGAEAAQFIVEGIKKQIASTNLDPEGLTSLLILLDQEMLPKGTYGETTCVMVVLYENGIAGASVGDSGALVFSKTGTQDLTANQARKPFLGNGCAIPIGFARKQLDGTLLVASDGLLKYTSRE